MLRAPIIGAVTPGFCRSQFSATWAADRFDSLATYDPNAGKFFSLTLVHLNPPSVVIRTAPALPPP